MSSEFQTKVILGLSIALSLSVGYILYTSGPTDIDTRARLYEELYNGAKETTDDLRKNNLEVRELYRLAGEEVKQLVNLSEEQRKLIGDFEESLKIRSVADTATERLDSRISSIYLEDYGAIKRVKTEVSQLKSTL